MSQKVLKYARFYLKKGYSVIPIHFGTKIPSISWKPYTKRLPTDDELCDWFDNEDDQNIGVVTGKISGLAIIDYDDPEFYKPDNTPSAKSPRGYHVYYKWKNGITNASLGKKDKPIDIRGSGGMVLAAPSIIDNKTYKWVKNKTPKLPLLALPNDIIVTPPKVNMHCPSEVKDGNRNNSLFNFCCSQVKLMSYRKYYEKIFIWNQSLDEPLEKHEVERTIDNVYENHKSYILDQLKNLMY